MRRRLLRHADACLKREWGNACDGGLDPLGVSSKILCVPADAHVSSAPAWPFGLLRGHP